MAASKFYFRPFGGFFGGGGGGGGGGSGNRRKNFEINTPIQNWRIPLKRDIKNRCEMKQKRKKRKEPVIGLNMLKVFFSKGEAMKPGRGTCGTFKVTNLTNHARTTFIDIFIIKNYKTCLNTNI